VGVFILFHYTEILYKFFNLMEHKKFGYLSAKGSLLLQLALSSVACRCSADVASYRKANSQSLDYLEVVVDKIHRTTTSIWKGDS
jgi:hypothetical protein